MYIGKYKSVCVYIYMYVCVCDISAFPFYCGLGFGFFKGYNCYLLKIFNHVIMH